MRAPRNRQAGGRPGTSEPGGHDDCLSRPRNRQAGGRPGTPHPGRTDPPTPPSRARGAPTPTPAARPSIVLYHIFRGKAWQARPKNVRGQMYPAQFCGGRKTVQDHRGRDGPGRQSSVPLRRGTGALQRSGPGSWAGRRGKAEMRKPRRPWKSARAESRPEASSRHAAGDQQREATTPITR